MKTIVKILAVLAIVACVVTLFAACNNEEDGDSLDEDDSIGFYVTYKNVKIEIGKSASDVIEKLGKADSTVEVGNCGDKGSLSQYIYNDIVIEVLTNANGNKTVDKIILNNDLVSTSKGISIGDSSDAVIKAYGKATEQTTDKIEYNGGTKLLRFTLKDGAVDGIYFYDYT